MSRKDFWHWLGLPCLDDIQALNAAALKQEEVLTSLKMLTAETKESLVGVRSELMASAERMEASNQKAIESSTEAIGNTLLRYSDGICKLLIERTTKLSDSIDVLETLEREISCLDRASQEKIEQTIAECRSQNELLRMLIANTLVEDISKVMNEA